MKKIVKNIWVLLNFWRLTIPLIIFIIDKKARNILKKDLDRININNGYTFKLCYCLILIKHFRGIFLLRIQKHIFLKIIFMVLFPPKIDLELSGNICGGFGIFHGQSSVIHCTSAGENFSVYQNVTVGRNKEHYSKFGNDTPVIGNNVSIYPGAVVAGGIEIGNNVEIAANSVVLRSVPDNCLVVGNPARIIRMNGKKVNIDLYKNDNIKMEMK